MTSDKVKFFIIVKLKSILPTTYLKKALDTISDERLLKTTISNHDLPQVMQNIFIEKISRYIIYITIQVILKILCLLLKR